MTNIAALVSLLHCFSVWVLSLTNRNFLYQRARQFRARQIPALIKSNDRLSINVTLIDDLLARKDPLAVEPIPLQTYLGQRNPDRGRGVD